MKLLAILMLVGLATVGQGVEMGVGQGSGIVGAQYGYSPEEWNAMPQSRKNAIKAMDSNSYGGAISGTPTAADTGWLHGGSLPQSGGGIAYNPQPQSAANPWGAAVPTGSEYYDGGGGSGGGGYADSGGYTMEALTLPPPKLLAQSPEWLAYLSALGLEESAYKADIDRQKGVYSAEAGRQSAEIPPMYKAMRRGVSGNMESRGMSRSGEFLRRLAETRQAEGRAQGGVASVLASQLSSLESNLASRMAELGARKAQQELSLRLQGYQ
jgi:hypothetical protein